MSLPASPALPVGNVVLKPGRRRTRTFTPEDDKDAFYWQKRLKNNEAAKRSRDKRRLHDFMLEHQVLALREENIRLRAELLAIQDAYGLLYTANRQGYYSHPGLVNPMHAFNSMTGFLYGPAGIYPNRLTASPVGSLLKPPPANEAVQRAEQEIPTCTTCPPDSPQVEARPSLLEALKAKPVQGSSTALILTSW